MRIPSHHEGFTEGSHHVGVRVLVVFQDPYQLGDPEGDHARLPGVGREGRVGAAIAKGIPGLIQPEPRAAAQDLIGGGLQLVDLAQRGFD